MFPNFKTEDITHHSKRTQAGNIEKAGTGYDVVMSKGTKDEVKLSENPISITTYGIPKSVTLESAITFFRENAKGDCKVLFTMTADWLDKYRVASRTAMNRLLKESEESEESVEDSTVTIDMSEIGE